MYNHILISTDGSELAQKGVDHGLSLAKALGGKVTVITATEPFPMQGAATGVGWVASPADFDRYELGQKQLADDSLAKVKAVSDKMGVACGIVHVPDTRPATAIVETADQLGCSLIVMSSHGRRGISRLLLGSQTSEVLATAKVPVLVVR